MQNHWEPVCGGSEPVTALSFGGEQEVFPNLFWSQAFQSSPAPCPYPSVFFINNPLAMLCELWRR